MKFGEILVQEKIITEEQLNRALDEQKNHPQKKLGEILLELDFIDIEQFTKIIDRQMRDAGESK
jgi:hypothetical protein